MDVTDGCEQHILLSTKTRTPLTFTEELTASVLTTPSKDARTREAWLQLLRSRIIGNWIHRPVYQLARRSRTILRMRCISDAKRPLLGRG
jgi:hypothetical protein